MKPDRLCCSRCGTIIARAYQPGRCHDEDGEPQTFDEHDDSETELVVWGEEGAPAGTPDISTGLTGAPLTGGFHNEYPFTVRFVDGRQSYPYARNAQEAITKAVARAASLGYVNPEVVLLQRADEPSTREVEHGGGWLWRLFFGGT